MSRTVKATIRLDLAGRPLPGFPRVVEATLDEAQPFDYAQADQASRQVRLPVEILDQLAVIALTPDKNVTVTVGGARDAPIDLHARGLLLIIGHDRDAVIAAPVVVRDSTDETAYTGQVRLRGMTGGT